MMMGSLNGYVMKEYMGMWTEVESEKTREAYRDMLTVPVNVNFFGKMLFNTDKIVSRSHIEQRPLTVKDEQVLQELGIMRKSEAKGRAESKLRPHCNAGAGIRTPRLHALLQRKHTGGGNTLP